MGPNDPEILQLQGLDELMHSASGMGMLNNASSALATTQQATGVQSIVKQTGVLSSGTGVVQKTGVGAGQQQGNCPDGQYFDSKYGACLPVGGTTPPPLCPAGQIMQADGSCLPSTVPCPEGQMLQPDGTCVAVQTGCPAGQTQLPDGSCVVINPPVKGPWYKQVWPWVLIGSLLLLGGTAVYYGRQPKQLRR